MRPHTPNIPTLFLGLVAGAFLPVSQWLVTIPNRPDELFQAARLPNRHQSRFQAAQVLTLPTDMGSSAFKVPAASNENGEKSFRDLDTILNRPQWMDLNSKSGEANRKINVVEISRVDGLERLLASVFDWQRSKSKQNKDIIFYIAPINSSPLDERLIADSIKKFLKYNRGALSGIKGKIAYLFHSQEKFSEYSLKKILARVGYPNSRTYMGLKSQPIRGKIDQIFWIRTTLSRWALVPKTGLAWNGGVISPEKIAAVLVDPGRKLVTAINLFSKNTFVSLNKTTG